jgi:dTDP-4-amino-4,6-dideoxygalactose transaminase
VLRFQRPSLPSTGAIERYLDLSREERWFSNGGPCWRLLQERLADRVGAYCVPVASGTLGLMAALAAALEPSATQRPRSSVLMPSFTFIATAQAAIWTGLEPALADISPGHWHLNPSVLEAALRDSGRFSAVVAVSAFGTPPPVEARQRWELACRQAGVPLIVDSAAGFGAVAEDGVAIGAQGDVEVVSFHATKPFAVGEGGAVFTRDRVLHEQIEAAVNFGFDPDRSLGTRRGTNAKMSELHAATALAVLDELDSILERRRRAAMSIQEGAGIGIGWQQGFERSTFQFVPVALPDEEQRARLVEHCRDRLEVRIYYEPLDSLAPHRWEVLGDLRTTHDLHRRVLCLPMANDLTESEIGEIVAVLRQADPVSLG